MRRVGTFLALLAALLAPPARPAQAQTASYSLALAGVSLGVLTFAGLPDSFALGAQVDHTPMGVFNGSFSAVTRPVAQGGLRYTSIMRTTRSARDVAILFGADGRVREVGLTPPADRTELTNAARVPAIVLDQATAFARLVFPSACPKAFLVYDGRRVVGLKPTGAKQVQARLICQMEYSVSAGPAYLRPLNLSQFRMALEYVRREDGRLVLDRLKLRTGILTLRLTRQ